MSDISSNGLVAKLTASVTYPAGIPLVNFASDVDPFDVPELEILNAESNINGEMVAWSVPKPVTVSIAVIPDSATDVLLGVLLSNNRVGFGKPSTKDLITIAVQYFGFPKPRIFTLGRIQSGVFGTATNSSGRRKSKTYKFVFQEVSY